MATHARFRLARALVALAALVVLVGGYVLSGVDWGQPQRTYLIDQAAWGVRQSTAHGRWLVLGPKGHPTSRVGFDVSWTSLRVEDHQAFRAPVAPPGRVAECKTTFQTEGLRVTAYSCRRGATHIDVRNSLDQPRAVLIEGRTGP